MKKILYYTIGVASLALLLIVTSCVNDPTTDSSSGVNDPNAFLTVEEAQGFFEESFADATRSGNIDLEQELFSAGDYTPLWGEARTSENDWQGSVDVPIIAGKKYRAIRSEFHHGHAHAYMVEMTQKLIVVKNKETNSTSQFLLTLIPDKDYYAKNKGDISDKFLSSGNKGDFSGYTLYTYKGFPVILSKYKSGRLIAGINILGIANEAKFEKNLDVIYEELNKMQFQSQTQVTQTRSGSENSDEVWIVEILSKETSGGYYIWYILSNGEIDGPHFVSEDTTPCPYCYMSFCGNACQTCDVEGCTIPWCREECRENTAIELCEYGRCDPSYCICCSNCEGECKYACSYCGKCRMLESCGCCSICEGPCKTGCLNNGTCHNNPSGKCSCP